MADGETEIIRKIEELEKLDITAPEKWELIKNLARELGIMALVNKGQG